LIVALLFTYNDTSLAGLFWERTKRYLTKTKRICGKNLYLSIISDILSVTALLKRQIGAIFTQRRE
jgi:hypothetical protein